MNDQAKTRPQAPIKDEAVYLAEAIWKIMIEHPVVKKDVVVMQQALELLASRFCIAAGARERMEFIADNFRRHVGQLNKQAYEYVDKVEREATRQ